MASSIRSKIASFEAQNENRRRSSSVSSRGKDPSPTASPAWRKRTTPSSADFSPANNSVSSIDGNDTNQRRKELSVRQPEILKQEPPAAKASPTFSTAAASQNRISRIRQQQQQAKEGAAHNNNATNIVEKRKQIKERRMMQQKQRSAIVSPSTTPEKSSTAPTPTSAPAQPSPSSLKSKLELARRTKYQMQPKSPERKPISSNYPSDSSAARNRVATSADAKHTTPGSLDYNEEASLTSASPNRNNNRMSMMLRMQHKMKGKDHVKRAKEQKPRPSVADSSVTSASVATSKSSATTAVADQNLSSNKNNGTISSLSRRAKQQKQQQQQQQQRQEQQRQQETIMQQQQQQQQQTQQRQQTDQNNRSQYYSHHHERRRKELQEKRRNDIQKSQDQASRRPMEPDELSRSPVRHHLHRYSTEDDDPTFSPSFVQNDTSSFSHLPSSSPRSGTDVVSDSNYGDANASLDHVTDDEATLTSVRRVMAKNGPSSPLDRPRYQNLTSNQSPRDSEVSADDPIIRNGNGKALHHRHRTAIKSSRSGEDFSVPISSSGTRSSENNRSGASNRMRSFELESEKRQTSRYGDDQRRREWLNEEKSDKAAGLGSAGGVFRTASSSDYDTDGDISKTSKTSRHSIALDAPSNSHTTDVNDFFARSKFAHSRKVDDDDRTFDYGDRDDDSAGSYAARRRREQERRAREAIAAAATEAKESTPEAGSAKRNQVGSPLINKDDVEHYTGSLDDPMTKVGVGVVGAVTIGCMVMGPVGLLVGAAAVGVGVGVLQIPEEKREKMQSKAQKKINEIHEKALEASETLSTSCGAAYNDSGMAEHLPQCLPGNDAVVETDVGSARSERIRGTASDAGPAKGVTKASSQQGQQIDYGMPTSPTPSSDRTTRNKKVACLRNVGILPASQIHGLDPAAQPRAWLDVVASANTTGEEKIEAIEEILILAKDKRRARIFLDEGILDWIVWTLSRYFEKINVTYKDVNWAHPEITPAEKQAAKLAAMCCVTLGKAHCAAIHTEGDLLLMSLYERGTVPEVRQVAQMLHEVPHHVRITKTPDPTIIDPSKEIFSLRQLTLPQAEDLARSVMEVANGRL